MQIQPSTAASAAAGNVSQAASKDRASGGVADAAHASAPAGVERVARSEGASADRDAQGGGQGLDARGEHGAPAETALATGEAAACELPVSPPEPPSQLDIVG
jgi:hypothetical protein